jgi:hypothetical protein
MAVERRAAFDSTEITLGGVRAFVAEKQAKRRAIRTALPNL